MKRNGLHVVLILFLLPLFSSSLFGQTWEFVKEKDGVKIYSRQEPGRNLKSFKGVTEIKESAEKVFARIEDVNHTEWWDKNLSQIKVLLYEKNKRAQYHIVYATPWPIKSRDLYADVTVNINQVTGERKISAVPLIGAPPQSKEFIRIKDYRQEWTVIPVNNYLTHVELEFYVDPDDKLPEWLLNMVFIESPVNTIKGLIQQIEKNKDKN